MLHPDLQQALNLQPGTDGKDKLCRLREVADLVERHGFRLKDQAMRHRYHINLFWSDEDDCWIADAPDLTHCSAHGATPEEALREVETAIEAWLEAQAAEGRPAPAPRYRPAIYATGRAA